VQCISHIFGSWPNLQLGCFAAKPKNTAAWQLGAKWFGLADNGGSLGSTSDTCNKYSYRMLQDIYFLSSPVATKFASSNDSALSDTYGWHHQVNLYRIRRFLSLVNATFSTIVSFTANSLLYWSESVFDALSTNSNRQLSINDWLFTWTLGYWRQTAAYLA